MIVWLSVWLWLWLSVVTSLVVGKLIDRLHVELRDSAGSAREEVLDIWEGESVQKQVEEFCAAHMLQGETREECLRLKNLATNSYNHKPSGPTDTTTCDSSTRSILQSINIQLVSETGSSDVMNIDFVLHEGVDPIHQSLQFCDKYHVTNDMCMQLIVQAVHIYGINSSIPLQNDIFQENNYVDR